MKFWQFLRFTAPGELLELARAVEQTPLHGIMLGDHTVLPDRIDTVYPYSKDGKVVWDAETPWPDVFTSIAAMAAVTERIHFSTDVLVLPLRSPFEVARTAATLSHLSLGRYSLGIGVGWMEEEFRALGVDFLSRGRRYDEMLDVMAMLWSGGSVEYHGHCFDFDRLTLSPRPYGSIPIYMAGGSKVAMRRAARRADGWIAGSFTADTIGPIMRTLRGYLVEFGRDPEQFEVIASCAANLDLYRRLEDLGVTMIIDLAPRDRIGPRATIAEKIDYINFFADHFLAGASL